MIFSKAIIIALIPALVVAQTCEDDATFTFNLTDVEGNPERTCTWLTKNFKNKAERIAEYCGDVGVKFGCQESCESCDVTCANNATFTFDLDNVEGNPKRYCTWLTDNYKNVESRQADYCSLDAVEEEVGFECVESCGFCPL